MSPLQATIYLLDKLDFILGKASEEEIRTDVLPMIFTTLESNSIQGQVEYSSNCCNSHMIEGKGREGRLSKEDYLNHR